MKMIKQLLIFISLILLVSCVWDTVGEEQSPEATTFAELEALDFSWQAHRGYMLQMDVPRAHARVKPMVTVRDDQDSTKIVYRGRAKSPSRIELPLDLPPQKTYVIEIATPLGVSTSRFKTAETQTISITSKPQSDL